MQAATVGNFSQPAHRANRPTVTVTVFTFLGLVIGGFDRRECRFQRCLAQDFSVEDCLIPAIKVLDCGIERTGSACARHVPIQRLLHRAALISITFGFVFDDCGRLVHAGIGHPERLKEIFPQELSVLFSRNLPDNIAEQEKTRIVVGPLLPGIEVIRIVLK